MSGPDEPLSRIPIRNIWFLLVYAHGLMAVRGRFDAAVDDVPDDAPLAALLARLLATAVERRIRRSLTRGYVRREAVLARVRGRIDVMRTESRRLLDLGRVACRFDEMTADTPRNRYIRAALVHVAGAAGVPAELGARCLGLSREMERTGVALVRATARSLAAEQIGRNDADDRLMLEAARLALELTLPAEDAGPRAVGRAERCEVFLRRLFESAVGGFYRAHLPRAEGWRVATGGPLDWDPREATPGLAVLLPGMRTDIVIDRGDRRLVIDTKFTTIVHTSRFGREILKSGHLYQLYAYLRSQEGRGSALDDRASGLLLYPSVGAPIDESVILQGHRLRFATVDLTASSTDIASKLLDLASSKNERT
ncbi:5-methylcytosine-specific restriction endonuclease system specificity protein McrC [Salinarimonas soli]|uniref:5-methylcytosine-specific restriction endonuclease system specificity protein McrC n=1 Tax=Salinarimonas soli TaxID=1638099 RepID=A0A5B2V6F6_9HYPH|nr:5-methylcytosine-specific restriction endonuclease system specificity protein McrC [Salinarimonas soli]KAA2234165.1 5-methylcytosine-specific restriction endonuclease system specificity protein McrC [Salinarimonas soli]